MTVFEKQHAGALLEATVADVGLKAAYDASLPNDGSLRLFNAIQSAILLIAVEAERTQQKEEHKDDTRTAATRLVPTPDATAGKDRS